MSAITTAAFTLTPSTTRNGFVKPAPRRSGVLARVLVAVSRRVPRVASHRAATADLAKGYARMAAACRARGRHVQADMFDQMARAVVPAVS